MRARWTTIAGVALVSAYAAALVAVTVTTASDRADRADRAPEHPEASAEEGFIEAWARSRSSTYRTVGTFERRSEVTGAAITSEDVVAQRPPRRLHRQLGGIDGRDDDRLLVCPAPPPDEQDDPQPCRFGPPGGRTYAEAAQREVDGVRSVVGGGDPLYEVTDAGEGCFALDLRRPDPRAPFGVAATFCFDEETGAPVRTEVRYEGGIRELVLVEEISPEVSDEDLEP
jgi:hypothetical protein